MKDAVSEAALLIKKARTCTAFTGAGISVESGIAPFRGEGGIWEKYDPRYLELSYFLAHPEQSWEVIKKLFFDHFVQAEPNKAHKVLARLEAADLLQAIITQNIDNLHHRAGSKQVIEFHGNSRRLVCLECRYATDIRDDLWQSLPPRCPQCTAVLKPDFVFFGESIPSEAFSNSFVYAVKSDVMLVIGSTGEVYPAASVPEHARQSGAKIIEINPQPSEFTGRITDLFLQGKATEVLSALEKAIFT